MRGTQQVGLLVLHQLGKDASFTAEQRPRAFLVAVKEEDGATQLLNFTFVGDVAKAVCLIMKQSAEEHPRDTNRTAFEAYNLVGLCTSFLWL